MNRTFGYGFFAGLLAAALAAGLGINALAAARTIAVDDGIQVTINGARFLPKDATGAPVELFAYNGTTYAPVRALCEAAGMTVAYDSATRTAQITTPGYTDGSYITAGRAKELALAHAGVRAADAVFVHTELDWDDGRAEYEVEFYSGNTEYDYDIDALTGEIRSFDHDAEHERPAAAGSSSGYITADRAREIALGRAPAGSSVVKCKLDQDDGRAVYEVELRSGSAEYDCEIDAVTGALLSWELD